MTGIVIIPNMVSVAITPAAAKEVEALPLVIRARLIGIVQRLERWPAVSGAKPLKGNLTGHYRIRTGDYRVQFFVVGDTLTIEQVGHRDGFYDE